MSKLPSGSFLPSSLLSLDTSSMMENFNSSFKNYALKVGFIQDLYEIDDKQNINKAVLEYKVVVLEQKEDGAQTPIIYDHCLHMDLFGSQADYFEMRLRKQDKVEKKDKSGDKIAKYQDGAMVLLLCVNGVSESALIIGGIKHPKRKSGLTKDKALAMNAEFNGINYSIDKDGALKILFKGPTDNTGKPTNKDVGGSYLTIDKEGSFEWGDGKKEKIRLDKKAKTISIVCEKDFSITTEAKLTLTAKEDVTISTKKKMLLEAQGGATLKVKELTIEADGPTKIKTKAFDLKADGAVMIKGQNITLDGQLINLGQGGQPAVTMSTQILGVGNLGIPVISSFIGPFSSKVFIAP
jgi:hypothetical protein